MMTQLHQRNTQCSNIGAPRRRASLLAVEGLMGMTQSSTKGKLESRSVSQPIVATSMSDYRKKSNTTAALPISCYQVHDVRPAGLPGTSTMSRIQNAMKEIQALQLLHAHQQQYVSMGVDLRGDYVCNEGIRYDVNQSAFKRSRVPQVYISPVASSSQSNSANRVIVKCKADYSPSSLVKRLVTNEYTSDSSQSKVSVKESTLSSISYTHKAIMNDVRKQLVRKSNPNDVILAPGTAYTNYSGNIKYRELIQKRCNIDGIASWNVREAAEDIVRQVTLGQEPAGRFLREDKGSGLWYIADYGDTVTRTIRVIRKELRSEKNPFKDEKKVDNTKSTKANVNLSNLNTLLDSTWENEYKNDDHNSKCKRKFKEEPSIKRFTDRNLNGGIVSRSRTPKKMFKNRMNSPTQLNS